LNSRSDDDKDHHVIVSISTIGLYASYGLPIWLAWRARRAGRCGTGPYTLGRWSSPVNITALPWVVLITVLFVLPANERTGYTFAGLLGVLGVTWFGWARVLFPGPRLNSSE
jgi:hypothetical protein